MSYGDHDTANVKTGLRHGDHDAAGTKTGGHHHEVPIIRRRQSNGNRKPMRFVSLHHHSTFSYLDGYQLPEAHIRRAEELGMGALAMSEHGNIDSHVKFEISASKSGIKPIFGCEVYMPSGPDWDKPDTQTQRKHHLTILARNDVGYRNLLALVSESWASGFYYDPTVTWDMLCRHKEGLVILSGCSGSLLFCSTVGGKGIEAKDASYKRGLKIARRFQREFGEWYFIEVQGFPELPNTCRFNALAGKLAKAVGARLVGTMDCHYTMLEEAEVQMILHNLRPGEKRTLEEQARDWGYDVPLCPPPNDKGIYRRLRRSGLTHEQAVEAIVSTEEIAQECNVTLPKLPMVRFPVPAGHEDARAYWRALLREGWKRRGLDRRPAEFRRRAKAQLRHEMELIESKDFVDYFLLVASGCIFMKDAGVPLWARGSVGASLAAYLLRITDFCPLDFPYQRFDRFISVDRMDLPDIDLDMPGDSRPMLRDFYEAMLGAGCVNNVGTFVQFKGKNSLDDTARVFQVPKYEVKRIKDFLIERSSGDLRASSTIEDTVDQFPAAREIWERYPELSKSSLLEGNVKAFGIHAAGLILSNEPITNVTAVLEKEVPKGSGNIIQAIAMDKKDAEHLGLLKLDVLGLNAAAMIWDAIRWLGWKLDDLFNLPLDDANVYDLFRRNDVVGVFQFDGRANRYVCGTVRPDQFSEIMDCIALCRPGPLHNGGAREYAEIKHGVKAPEFRHQAVNDITELTKFQIIYQEQVLDICRIIGGFDQVAVADARRIIAKKEGEQAFSRMKELFVSGATTLHKRSDYSKMSRLTAESIFGDLITSGSYAFNAPHSASYGLVAYWSAFLKHHYPDVFYAGSLTQSKKDEERTHALLRDADKHGVRVRPPDPARSGAGWQPIQVKSKRPTIRAGFEQIKGVGEKTAAAIEEYRNSVGGLEHWDDLINVKGIGPKSIEMIREWTSMKDPFGAFQLDKDIRKVKEAIRSGALGELPNPTHTAHDLPYEQGKTFDVCWIGTVLNRNIRDIFETNRARTGEELARDAVKDPELNEWAQLVCEDEADQLLLKLDRWKYPKFKEAIFNFRLGKDLLLVQGVRPRYVSARQIQVKRLWVIDPE